MKYNSIGEQLIAKAKELDPNYKPDKFNDMSEAIDILLNNNGGDIWLDITPYLQDGGEGTMSISQEGYDLVSNAFSIATENPINKYVGILIQGNKLIFNGLIDSDLSDKKGFDFILNIIIDGVKSYIGISIYNDRSIEVKNGMDSSNKIWYDLDKKSGTITQNQYDEIKSLIDNDSLAGITLSQYTDGYYPLVSFSTNGTMTFVSYSISVEDEGLGVRNLIFSEAIVILPDLAIYYIKDPIYTPILTKNLSSQSIISVKTDGYQEDLTIGDGLEIKDGALREKVLNVSITNILTDATKIQTIFTAMQSTPASKTHTGVYLDNDIPLSAFQDCDKIVLDLSGLSALGLNVGGELIFIKGFNTNNYGRAFYLNYMTGDAGNFSIATIILASSESGNGLNRLVVEHSGTN